MRILVIAPPLLGDTVMIVPHLCALKRQINAKLFVLASHEVCDFLKSRTNLDLRDISVSSSFFRMGPVSHEEIRYAVTECDRCQPDLVFDHLGNANSLALVRKIKCKKTFGVSFEELTPYFCSIPIKTFQKWITDCRNASQCFADLYTLAGIDLNVSAPRLIAQSRHVYPNPRALINPGAGSEQKRWRLESFIEVAERLSLLNITPVFLVGPAELELKRRLLNYSSFDVVDGISYSLSELCAFIYEFDVLVSNDCAIMHLGAALGVPTIAIFAGGLHNPVKWFPYGTKSNRVFVGDPQTNRSEMPVGNWQDRLTAPDITSAAIELLQECARA